MEIVLYGSIAWRHPIGFGRVIELASEFNWDCVDARGMSIDVQADLTVRLNAFGYDMLGPRQIRPSARRELKSRLDDAGKKLSGIYCSSPLNLEGELGTGCRDLVREYLQLAADLGAEWVRPINNTTTTYTGAPCTPDEAYNRAIDGMRDVGRTAADLGVGMLFENNENTITSDAESLLRNCRDVEDVCRVGIAYDGTNAYFQGLDPVAELEQLAGRIDVMHLKNVRRHDAERWDYMPRGNASYEWVGLADGDVDWPKLVAQAAAAGFDGQLVFEYVNPFKGMPPGYWDTLPEPVDAAKREGAFLRKIVDGLTR